MIMDKKFWIGAAFGLIAILGAIMFFVSGQTGPGSEATTLYLFDAEPLNASNACMAGAPAPCIDTDGGYAPATPSNVAASVITMIPSIMSGGGIIFWTPYLLTPQCVQASEVCNATTGEL